MLIIAFRKYMPSCGPGVFANYIKHVNHKSAGRSFNQNILIYCMFRILVGIAWTLAVVLASPQAVVWRVLKHPVYKFYQVVPDINSIQLIKFFI